MLRVENLPEPPGLISNGEASVRESRLQYRVSRPVQRRGIPAAVECRLKSLIHI